MFQSSTSSRSFVRFLLLYKRKSSPPSSPSSSVLAYLKLVFPCCISAFPYRTGRELTIPPASKTEPCVATAFLESRWRKTALVDGSETPVCRKCTKTHRRTSALPVLPPISLLFSFSPCLLLASRDLSFSILSLSILYRLVGQLEVWSGRSTLLSIIADHTNTQSDGWLSCPMRSEMSRSISAAIRFPPIGPKIIWVSGCHSSGRKR
ncbi:hypothetical protein VTI28DRAFT_3421 [Corynascus sepedonium]